MLKIFAVVGLRIAQHVNYIAALYLRQGVHDELMTVYFILLYLE